VKISESDRQLVLGALDSLMVTLADYDHEWTVGERTIYDETLKILTASAETAVKIAIASKGRQK
jgi:hypothetical protein